MEIEILAEKLGQQLLMRGLMLSTAESCTGGWIAEAVTDISGSSQWFDRGFVTYSNDAKQEMLGVLSETLCVHGAVSEQTVREMVQGVLKHSQSQIAVAVSGIAGPRGGSVEKPVGLVWVAWAQRGGATTTISAHFSGSRREIRRQTVKTALQGLLDLSASTSY